MSDPRAVPHGAGTTSAASDASGVTVSFEGTSYSATTSTDGTWVMSNVPTRTYTIVVECVDKSGNATQASIIVPVDGKTKTSEPVPAKNSLKKTTTAKTTVKSK